MSRPASRALAALSTLAAFCILSSLPALGADSVVGKWEATIESPRGSNEVVMEFKGSDEELQGAWTDRRGTGDLEDVKYEDGKLTFERNLEFQGNALTIGYEATIDGDTMSVTMKTPRGEREFTAKRVE